MATMNVGSSQTQSQEYWSQNHEPQQDEDELDEDGEGLTEAPTGRSSNYTVEEDKLLCRAWCNIGMDPTVGADQSRNTYWVRIKEYFDERNTSGIDRTDRSLRSRWGIINAECQRWAAVLKHVDDLNPSGTADRDRVSCAFVHDLLFLNVCD